MLSGRHGMAKYQDDGHDRSKIALTAVMGAGELTGLGGGRCLMSRERYNRFKICFAPGPGLQPDPLFAAYRARRKTNFAWMQAVHQASCASKHKFVCEMYPSTWYPSDSGREAGAESNKPNSVSVVILKSGRWCGRLCRRIRVSENVISGWCIRVRELQI